MKIYSENKEYKLYKGSMLDMLQGIEPCSIDAIVTDPPYELNFMNKGWDNSGIAFQKETWKKCFSALKSGGYLLAFGGSRTFHRIAVAIEDAGFEIRDTIMWIYGSGFPKSMDLGKSIESKLVNGSANPTEFKNLKGTKTKAGNWGISNNAFDYGARPSDYSADGHERTVNVEYTTAQGKMWDGWGTCLKPAYEPIIVARKPCDGSTTDNVLEYGVGGINIDECRIGNEIIRGGTTPNFRDVGNKQKAISGINKLSFGQISNAERIELSDHQGRFPANVMLTYDDTDYEEVCGGFPNTKSNGGNPTMSDFSKYKGSMMSTSELKEKAGRKSSDYIAPKDSGNASRYFYCAKASKKDRDEGLDNFVEKQKYYCDGSANSLEIFGSTDGGRKPLKNIHPTVKPTELMQYLVRLVTPNGGTILDPFNGSGSTGKAVMYENVERNKNYKYIGIDLNDTYLEISRARIEYAQTGVLSVPANADSKDVTVDEKPAMPRQRKLF